MNKIMKPSDIEKNWEKDLEKRGILPLSEKDLMRCPDCKRKFKKISEYQYKPVCKHYPKGMMLSKG